ncbi:MAG: hypothetical protein Q9219_001465 [cf. Caloplaca sp. 3 TL-2023]
MRLMNSVYDCISKGKVGIFESPTGTGKSLSLICSTLTWLRDEQGKALDHEVEADDEDGGPDWVVEQARQQRAEKLVRRRRELESRLNTIREKETRKREQYERGEPVQKRAKASQETGPLETGDEDQYMLEDYESDNGIQKPTTSGSRDAGLSVATLQLMQKLDGPSALAREDLDADFTDQTKIFFCSRTHSQLAQFVTELRRVHFPPPPWFHAEKDAVTENSQQQIVIVTLPYQLLLLKSAREALGISLKGHVIVIDEAHNLMDAISNIYSIAVTQAQLHRCQDQLRIYLQKFRNKLKGKNRVYVTQTVRLIDSVSNCLDRHASQHHSNTALIGVNELMTGKGVDQINLYKLVRYLNDSKLARKVDNYTDFRGNCESSLPDSRINGTPVLTHVQGFLQALMNPAAEGRFFFEREESNTVVLKYMLLDPTFHFKDVVEDARAVVLAGGTMAPMDDFVRQLFAYVPAERLETWSCGHIIPKDNLFVRCVSSSPAGKDFDFSFANRESASLIDALGDCLVHLAATIPDGLVVFFPSYTYLGQVSVHWQKGSTWTRLERHKCVFKESKGSSSVEDILQQYTEAVDGGRGALLMSVVGGKLSEGINFSDKLGRSVVVVGLPFPNIHSAQWKAKLEYIERREIDRGGSDAEGKAAGREFYENACMRAVNQSIGRAIRHQNDFSSILLLDRRYSTPRIVNKLPGWIKQGLPEDRAEPTFPELLRGLCRFYQSKVYPS